MSKDLYIYQDIDLKGNEIKNINKLSSQSGADLNVEAGTNSVKLNSNTEIFKTLTVSGTSSLKDNVVIGTSEIDTTHNLTVGSVKIAWDSSTNSLVFTKITGNTESNTGTEGS